MNKCLFSPYGGQRQITVWFHQCPNWQPDSCIGVSHRASMRGYLQECVWLQSGLLIISRFSPQHWWLLSPSCIGRAHHLDNFSWTVYSSPSQDLETTWLGQDSTWLERRQGRLARISGKVLPPLLLCTNINRLDLESLLKNSHRCTDDKDACCYVQGTAFSDTYR